MTTAQAIEQTSESHLRHQLTRGHWQRPVRGVIVTHSGTLSRRDHINVALAASPTNSAVSGLTALELDGLEGFTVTTIHVTIPNGGRKPRVPGASFHQSSLLATDVHPVRSPRRTTVERSIIDAASWTSHPRHARAIAIAAIQQGLTTPLRVRAAAEHRGPVKNKALVIESTFDAAGGIQSLPERDFSTIWRAVGLPRLARQERRLTPAGTAYLDAYCPELDLSVEIHGLPHHDIEHWDRDLARSNELVIGGDRLLVFSSYATRHEKLAVADQLSRMALACGWPGPAPDPTRLAAQLKSAAPFIHRRRPA